MKRPEITVVNHYDILPYKHGGTQAIRGLYKGLSEWFDINIIFFTKTEYPFQMLAISDCIRVYPILIPKDVERLQNEMCKKFSWGADESPAVACYYHKSKEIIKRVRQIAQDSLILIAEHAYTWNIIQTACPTRHLWYRVHNVEYDYKSDINGKDWVPKELLQEIYNVEKACCKNGELVLAISQMEADRLVELYELDKNEKKKVFNINAGYDSTDVNPIYPSNRTQNQSQYEYVGMFIATGNSVTVQAAKKCIGIAREFPNIQIVILGNVGNAYPWEKEDLPQNVVITGVVSDEEKKNFLISCDFALNLVQGGAGVNIKMFEYFAHGIPVIATKHGARGIDVTDGQDCILAENDNHMEIIHAVKRFCGLSIEEKDSLAKHAFKLLNDKYTWQKIALRISKKIESMYDISLEEFRIPIERLSYYDMNPLELIMPQKERDLKKSSSSEKKTAHERTLSSQESKRSVGMHEIDSETILKLQNPNYSFALRENIYTRFRFPFRAVKPGSKIILYGGGVVGNIFLQQVAKCNYCTIVAVCDQNPSNTDIVEAPVISLACLAGMPSDDYDKIVIAIEKRDVAKEIRENLLLAGIASHKILWIDPSKRNLKIKLRSEKDAEKWFALLQEAVERYLVVFTVKDTPGNHMPRSILKNIHNAGFDEFKTDLWRTYIGVIQKGTILFQGFHEREKRTDYTYKSPDGMLSIVATSQAWRQGNCGDICINDRQYAVDIRGVNIVVYDLQEYSVIDSIGFDSHDPGIVRFEHLSL